VTYWFAIKATDDSSNQASWTSSGTVSTVNTLNSTYAKSDSNMLPSTEGRWHFGFEGITDNVMWEEIGTAGSIQSEGTIVHGGSNSCEFLDLTTQYSGREIYSATCTVTAGNDYYGGVWAHVPTLGGSSTNIAHVSFKLAVRWYDAADAFISETSSEGIKLAAFAAWEKIIYSTLTAPGTATQARFVVAALETNNLQYDPCVDDAEFIKATGAGGDSTSPCAVSNLTALAEGSDLGGRITLKWSAPGDDGTMVDNSGGGYLAADGVVGKRGTVYFKRK